MKTFLFILVSIVAFTSTLSGLIMISDPNGGILKLPLNLLHGTPFKNYFVPGILLTGLVGGVNTTAVYCYLSRSTTSYNWSIAGGIMITGWIILQLALTHSVHSLHFIYLGAGILIILIGYQLKGKWAV